MGRTFGDPGEIGSPNAKAFREFDEIRDKFYARSCLTASADAFESERVSPS